MNFVMSSWGCRRGLGAAMGVGGWLMLMGDVESVIAEAEEILGIRDLVTGVSLYSLEFALPLIHLYAQYKPEQDTSNVFLRPIPQTPYSIRLFPGSASLQEFCMDFVHTSTGQPVNSPFAFELWSTADASSLRPAVRLVSLERSWGYAQQDIIPGGEKFVLRDGMRCILRRPGRKDLRFTVPTRAVPVDSSDADELDFPLVVC